MSIFTSLFGGAPAQAPAPVQQPAPTPGNIPANAATTTASTATPATAPNGVVPGTTDITGGKTASGLDQFADLFNTVADPEAQGQPLFNVTHDKVMESARKQDFRVPATEEQMANIAKGGPEAAQAMFDIMNAMVQQGYGQSAFTTTKLIEGGLARGNYAKVNDVESTIRKNAVSNSLREDNPLFSHAAAQPIIASIQNSLLTKFPTATTAEISEMARKYVSEFAKMAQAPEAAIQQQNKSKVPKSEDWGAFFPQ